MRIAGQPGKGYTIFVVGKVYYGIVASEIVFKVYNPLVSLDSVFTFNIRKPEKYFYSTNFVKMYINPAQQMYTVELTLPDGGTVIRGTSEIEDYSNVSVSATKNYIVSDAQVVYEDVTVADYTIVETEPQKTATSKNFYNIVSSFSDATSDRLFAFTAAKGFIGNDDMEVKYREKGGSEWSSVVATRTTENTTVPDEDYFKAERSTVNFSIPVLGLFNVGKTAYAVMNILIFLLFIILCVIIVINITFKERLFWIQNSKI